MSTKMDRPRAGAELKAKAGATVSVVLGCTEHSSLSSHSDNSLSQCVVGPFTDEESGPQRAK